MCSGGDVQVAPATTRASADDLIRGMTHGFFMKGATTRSAIGLTAGLVTSDLLMEVVNGKPVARLGNIQIAFSTGALLTAGLTALGDMTTVGTSIATASKGIPWQEMSHPVTAPAAHCKDVDVLQTAVRR